MRFHARSAAPPRRRRPVLDSDSVEAENIRTMLDIEREHEEEPSASDHLASYVTAFSGSMLFVWIHVAWFALWVVLNEVLLSDPFDEFPFGVLTMVVSLEAIFLSTFVLITQNRQAAIEERRSQMDLQVNLMAEQEVTKLMEMVAELHEHAGLSGRHDDPEVQQMARPTDVRKMAKDLDEMTKSEREASA